jgi:pyruvate formate lyase activating enzyme
MKTLYHTTDKGVQCDVCPHACHLAEGQYGICHSRVNRQGILISEGYGRPCALNIDPIEKKPLLHYHPGSRCLSVASTGCNFSCLNCQNADISQVKPSDVSSIDLPPEKLVDECAAHHCPAIAYTYTEPLTFFEYTYDSACLAHERGIGNIIVSAGYVNEAPLRQLCKVIDAANIDLKSFSDDIYKQVSHGTLAPVLRTLKILKDEGVWLEITNLLIPALNDDATMLHRMCHWLFTNDFEDTPLHFSRFFPMYKMDKLPPTPLSTLTMARTIAQQEGIRFVYIGNAPDIEGENTYCPQCHRLLLRRDGYDILANHLKDGCCPSCGTPIPGRW